MPRAKRSDTFHHSNVAIAHCVQRCVRRAFLAGDDPVSGKSFEYRRDWIRKRLELLASVFGIDVLSYSVMSNHVHLVLRTRPDVVKSWDDLDVAKRWLRLFPGNAWRNSSVNRPSKTSPTWPETPKDWSSFASDCRIFPGLCGLFASPSLAKPTKKTSAPVDSGKDGSRLRRFSMKLGYWPAPCTSISIRFEPPW